MFHFRAGRDGRWLRRIGWPSLWFAAAVLAKASGLVFGVLCLIVIEAERRLAPLWNRRAGGVSPRRLDRMVGGAVAHPRGRRSVSPPFFRADLTQIVLLGMAMVFVYCGSDWQPQASGLDWARQLPDGPLPHGDGLVLRARAASFPTPARAIARQVTHNLRGAGVYILG